MYDFEVFASSTAVIWKNKSYSYSLLKQRIEYWQLELRNIAEGKIVALESDFTPETVAMLFALIKLKSIIVPLDISFTENNEKKLKIAEVQLRIRVFDENNIKLTNLD